MGRYDFEFGFNEPGVSVPKGDIPTYAHQPDTPNQETPPLPEPYTPCMGAVLCSVCGKRHGLCTEVNEQLTGIKNDDSGIYTDMGVSSFEWENDKMIPRDSGNSASGGRSSSKKKGGSGLRYLSTDMLNTDKQTALIVDARTQDDNFKPGKQLVVVKIKFKGEMLLWTLRPGNPNMDVLADAMGDDETAWKDRSIELFNEVDSFDHKVWMRCEVLPTVSASKRK